MADEKENSESHLSHYESEFYNPVKAHEYYMRTRDLKGRQNVGDLKSKSQKESWKVTKSNIDKAKTTESKTQSARRTAEVQRVRQSAQQKRAQIQGTIKQLFEKLKENQQTSTTRVSETSVKFLDKLAEQRTRQLEKIAKETKAKLDRVPPLPKGSSDSERAARAKEIAQIKNDGKSKSDFVISLIGQQENQIQEAASTQIQTIINRSSQTRKNAQESSRQNSERIANELKGAIDTANKTYIALKKQTKDKYDAVYQREFEAIKTNT